MQAAGRLAARMLADGLETRHKDSVTDVVSAADHAAEQLVVSGLRKARPADGVQPAVRKRLTGYALRPCVTARRARRPLRSDARSWLVADHPVRAEVAGRRIEDHRAAPAGI